MSTAASDYSEISVVLDFYLVLGVAKPLTADGAEVFYAHVEMYSEKSAKTSFFFADSVSCGRLICLGRNG